MDVSKAKLYQAKLHDTLLTDVMPFWMNSDLIDREHGGYITSVDRYGKSYNNDKSVWFQGRGLITFSALCRKYGTRPQWLDAAVTGKNFLEKYCVDTDGRMFFTVTREGKPLRKRRYMFSESFYAAGMAEYYAVTKDQKAWEKAEKCFETMLMLYRTPGNDPYRITPKTYSGTRDERAAAILMVLLSTAQILRRCNTKKASYYARIAKEISDAMISLHYRPDLHCVLENVSADGSFIDNPSGRTVNPGHSCENAWFLMNEALYRHDDGLMKKALNILDWSLELGWDQQFGGIYYFTDISGRPCEQLEWDMKLWWVHNEAMIAALYAYAITKQEKYSEWFEKITDYSLTHFSDAEYGEWYGYLHRDGTVSHTQKGSMWKGPFHLPRCLMICDSILDAIIKDRPAGPVL